eukprot:scaffold81249_cov67-Phaeocystis_antarctica.AAC.8
MRHTLSSKSGAAARKNWRVDSTTALSLRVQDSQDASRRARYPRGPPRALALYFISLFIYRGHAAAQRRARC